MFNVGGPEIVLVILVALVVLGPEQLPKAMRTFGNVMSEIRKLSNGFQNEMRDAMNAMEVDATPSGSQPSGTATGSAKGPSAPSAPAGSEAVDEVVARNVASDADADADANAGGDRSDTAQNTDGTGASRPSAADRAAG